MKRRNKWGRHPKRKSRYFKKNASKFKEELERQLAKGRLVKEVKDYFDNRRLFHLNLVVDKDGVRLINEQNKE